MVKPAKLTGSDIDRMPRFQFHEEANSAVHSRVAVALLDLIELTAIRMLARYPIVG